MKLKTTTKLLLFHIIILIISCNKVKDLNDSEKGQIIEDIKKMLDNYHMDIAESGLTAEFKYLDESSDFFWVPPGYESALSYDSVKKILESNAKAFHTIEFHWDTLQIFPLSKEIANYHGVVGGSMIDTAGVKSKILLIESGSIVKRNNGWKLLSGQSATLTIK